MVISEMGLLMQAQKHYSRAPITEAIIDFRVALAEGFVADKFEVIYSRIKEDLPIIQPFHTKVGTVTFGHNDELNPPLKIDASQELSGFWFRSRDNLHTFQATTGGFTFNRLAPYNSWEEFSAEARRLWNIYNDICKPICVKRAAIRYVNQINLPADGSIELKDFLKTVPEVSPTLPQAALQTFLCNYKYLSKIWTAC